MKTNTINKTEINKFNKLAAEWWDPEGSFKPLHKFNPIRIKYICSSPEKLKIKKKFDVLSMLEIVEHVDDINFF